MIARLAGRQHGVVARRQLLVAGVTKGAIEARLRSDRLHLLHRGVYAAGHLAPKALARALAQAQVLKLIPRGHVPSAPGRRAVAKDTAPTRSGLEDQFLALIAQFALPRPLVNEHVLGHEVGMHWPEARLVVELDGYTYHGTRQAFEDDRARDAALQAAGWHVIRVTDRALADPGRVASTVGRLLTPEPARAPP